MLARQTQEERFQRSEFLLDHGFVDMIVERKNLRAILIQLLGYFADSAPEATHP